MADCRVMLVDDHAVFRETLGVGLGHDQKLTVVAEAGSTTEVCFVGKDFVLLWQICAA